MRVCRFINFVNSDARSGLHTGVANSLGVYWLPPASLANVQATLNALTCNGSLVDSSRLVRHFAVLVGDTVLITLPVLTQITQLVATIDVA